MRARDFDREKFMLEEWPEALESGEFKQGKGCLLEDGKYCCLGVACELLSRKRLLPRNGVNGWIDLSALPQKAQDLLGISTVGHYRRTSLATLNDRGKSFKQIAKLIRRLTQEGQFTP